MADPREAFENRVNARKHLGKSRWRLRGGILRRPRERKKSN